MQLEKNSNGPWECFSEVVNPCEFILCISWAYKRLRQPPGAQLLQCNPYLLAGSPLFQIVLGRMPNIPCFQVFWVPCGESRISSIFSAMSAEHSIFSHVSVHASSASWMLVFPAFRCKWRRREHTLSNTRALAKHSTGRGQLLRERRESPTELPTH